VLAGGVHRLEDLAGLGREPVGVVAPDVGVGVEELELAVARELVIEVGPERLVQRGTANGHAGHLRLRGVSQDRLTGLDAAFLHLESGGAHPLAIAASTTSRITPLGIVT